VYAFYYGIKYEKSEEKSISYKQLVTPRVVAIAVNMLAIV